MSAYSDWKVGALTDDEYRQACEHESRKDKAEEDDFWTMSADDDWIHPWQGTKIGIVREQKGR